MLTSYTKSEVLYCGAVTGLTMRPSPINRWLLQHDVVCIGYRLTCLGGASLCPSAQRSPTQRTRTAQRGSCLTVCFAGAMPLASACTGCNCNSLNTAHACMQGRVLTPQCMHLEQPAACTARRPMAKELAIAPELLFARAPRHHTASQRSRLASIHAVIFAWTGGARIPVVHSARA